MNITDTDYNRRISHIFVNKTDNKSISDSIAIAEKYVNNDIRKKVFVLPDHESISKKIGIGGLASSKRGIICGIDNKGKSESECLDFMTYQTKFGLLILTDENLNVSDFNCFHSETFLKKSVDVIMHKQGLLINPIEESMLKQAKKQLIDGNKIVRNFAFRIYPDPSFSLSIELYKQMFAIYGHIDSVGIILTQLFVNSQKYDSFAYYNFFFREDNEFIGYDMNKEFDNICQIIRLNDTNKSLLYEKLMMKNMDFPEETKQPSEVNENEENTNVSVDEMTDDMKTDQAVKNLTDEFLEKIESGEFTETSMFTQQDKVYELIDKHYADIEHIIDIPTFVNLFQKEMQSRQDE